MDKIKLCKDCEHHKSYHDTEYWHVIHHQCMRITGMDLVDGRVFRDNQNCEMERSKEVGACGQIAKYFTPRKSLWQRVKGWLG